ncbi:4Fe-4S dicluster domain-containing protein [Desulfofundulus thermosubterraneus]|uniref:Fe-S-cluster-containing hydrogenase component 2 n=1 Tax=Desulfofundulus thermosubterraneus DSM 16057 TaxID=1121432 RepID=A0A1M6JYP0_9FIRM|nr:4Fe-4S dicluster domain-containing protein [Desulfofundulus thermosubterraneus]SHJ51839.1 Fe-S-cluster-containing hydrogenase component 2 [Desulfofundulus thermosubterraneus DSM 16057]
MILHYQPEKCTGCHLCELACSGYKEGVFNPALARLQVSSGYKGDNLVNEARLCEKCFKCADACSNRAIVYDRGPLSLVLDDCVQCGACIEVCPTAVLRPDGRGFPLLCDYCQGEPYCVKWCPHEALSLKEVE